jgi:cyclophilin family peptidyl-prolyl cis-trans isomerase
LSASSPDPDSGRRAQRRFELESGPPARPSLPSRAYEPPPDHEDFDHRVFGQVTSGLDLLDRIAAAGTTTGGADGPPKLAVQITEIRVS